MGAWAVGMQANDDAADATIEFEEQIEKVAKQPSGVTNLLKEVATRYEDTPLAVLGVADALLDRGLDLTQAKAVLAPFLLEELDVDSLENWDDPFSRLAALEHFGDRLLGNPVAAATIGSDNPSLPEAVSKPPPERNAEGYVGYKSQKDRVRLAARSSQALAKFGLRRQAGK